MKIIEKGLQQHVRFKKYILSHHAICTSLEIKNLCDIHLLGHQNCMISSRVQGFYNHNFVEGLFQTFTEVVVLPNQ